MSNWFEYHILSIVDGLGLFSFYSPLSRVVSFWEHAQYDPHIQMMFGNDVNSPCNSIYFIYVIYLCLPIVVSNTYCVVFLFCLSCVLCTLCCQCLWIVHYWLPLWYSLLFVWWCFQRHFQQYFSYIVAVRFIGGGNRRTRRFLA
jgi:hypothetical protein